MRKILIGEFDSHRKEKIQTVKTFYLKSKKQFVTI